MKVANRFFVIAGVLAAVICGSAPEAAAQEPILGCVLPGTGLLRIPPPNEGCKANEIPLGFNDLPLLVALRNQVLQLQSGLAAETAARIAGDNAVAAALCAEADRLPGNPSDAVLALCGPLAKRVFVTEATVSPNLGGLAGADAQCTSLAQTAGLPGIYKAWLSDETTSAKNRLTHSSVPYARVDGIVVANNFADLTDGSLLAPITITQNGSVVSTGPSVFAWTGTTADGSTIAGHTCNNWTVANLSFNAASGQPGSTSGSWTDTAALLACGIFGASVHMYCFQQ